MCARASSLVSQWVFAATHCSQKVIEADHVKLLHLVWFAQRLHRILERLVGRGWLPWSLRECERCKNRLYQLETPPPFLTCFLLVCCDETCFESDTVVTLKSARGATEPPETTWQNLPLPQSTPLTTTRRELPTASQRQQRAGAKPKKVWRRCRIHWTSTKFRAPFQLPSSVGVAKVASLMGSKKTGACGVTELNSIDHCRNEFN